MVRQNYAVHHIGRRLLRPQLRALASRGHRSHRAQRALVPLHGREEEAKAPAHTFDLRAADAAQAQMED